MLVFRYWKKVWYTITGQNKLVTEAEVNIVLTAVKDDILYGLNKYKPFTQASFNEWRILTKRSEGYVQDEENMLTDQLAEKIAIIMASVNYYKYNMSLIKSIHFRI